MDRRTLDMTVCVILGSISALFSVAQSSRATPEEAYQIGIEAYVYFNPLVTMDVTRRQLTNIEAGKMAASGPMKPKPIEEKAETTI